MKKAVPAPEFRRPEASKSLRFLYHTLPGRALLSVLIRPGISLAAGKFLSSRFSRVFIPSFVKNNHIDLNEAQKGAFTSFNDCFTRQLKKGARPIDLTPEHLISPCDALLSVFEIERDATFSIKGTRYTLSRLLQKEMPSWDGGVCAIFRLTVSDYHRYCYPDNGTKGESKVLRGTFHTVNPIAQERYPIYHTNTREYTVLHTENFGDVIQMEVGALLVGKIVNRQGNGAFLRGEEKGYFEFGGSTIVLLFQKDRVAFDEQLFEYSRRGYEKKVRMGEKIGEKA